jgi:hypothetical protein
MPYANKVYKQIDNTEARGAKRAKIEIRRNVAAAIGGVPLHVFDAFAGAGVLHRAVWRDLAASYTGCDKRYFKDGRRVFVADNRRVLRALDLSRFNVFDLDAYGSPWEQAVIIAAKRKLAPGERAAIIVTDNMMQYRNAMVAHGLRDLTGLRHRATPGKSMSRNHAAILAVIWNEIAARMSSRLVRVWQADNATGGVGVAYVGAVFEGVPEAERVVAREKISRATAARTDSFAPEAGLELRSLEELAAGTKTVIPSIEKKSRREQRNARRG